MLKVDDIVKLNQDNYVDVQLGSIGIVTSVDFSWVMIRWIYPLWTGKWTGREPFRHLLGEHLTLVDRKEFLSLFHYDKYRLPVV